MRHSYNRELIRQFLIPSHEELLQRFILITLLWHAIRVRRFVRSILEFTFLARCEFYRLSSQQTICNHEDNPYFDHFKFPSNIFVVTKLFQARSQLISFGRNL